MEVCDKMRKLIERGQRSGGGGWGQGNMRDRSWGRDSCSHTGWCS